MREGEGGSWAGTLGNGKGVASWPSCPMSCALCTTLPSLGQVKKGVRMPIVGFSFIALISRLCLDVQHKLEWSVAMKQVCQSKTMAW